MLRRAGWIVALVASLALPLLGQESAAPAAEMELPPWSDFINAYLEVVEARTVAIAEDFPEELYNTYHPGGDPDVRSAAEILLHLAFVNERMAFQSATEEGKQAYAEAHQGPPNAKDFRFVSKAETVAKVRGSFEFIREQVLLNPDPALRIYWMQALVHSSEHYGNLITYYRANRLVPPSSRQ